MHVILYYSDGESSQYKNHKIFVNFCYHKIDYVNDAE